MNSRGLRYSTRSFLVSVAAIGVCGGMLGCPVLNTDHCAYPEGGGAVCGEGLMCSKCEINNNGCVAPENVTQDCMVDAQTSAPDDTTEATVEPTTLTTTPGPDPDTTLPTASDTTLDVSTSTSTDPATTDPDTSATTNTTGTECNPNEGMAGCAIPEPYCNEAGECVSCVELDCPTLDPEKPACNTLMGLCVECTSNDDCPDNEPFCDVNTATCNTCTTHEHCPDTACNLETGECFPEDNIIYVDNTPTMNNMMYCSDNPGNNGHDPLVPICRLSIALTKVVPDEPATIKIKQGQLPQDQANAVPPGVTVAIVRNGGTPATLARNGSAAALSMSGQSLVFVHRISAFSTTKGVTSPLIQCSGDSTLWLDRVNLFDGKYGVTATDCMVHIRRSVVFQNQSGGIDITTSNDMSMSKLWLENSFVTDNGDVFGIRVAKRSFLEVVYSTIVANTKGAPMVPQITCVTIAQNPNMRLRNSFLADDNNLYVTGCDQMDVADDDSNYKIIGTSLQSLVDLGAAMSYNAGVVRPKINGPLAGVATWKVGDPADDYDMDNIRPTREGPDYAGADIP